VAKVRRNQRKSEEKANEFTFEDFTELNETDKKVFLLFTQHPELTQTEIGKILNLHVPYITAIKQKPAFQRAMNEFNQNWIDRIIDMRYEAVNKLKDLLNSENQSIAIRAVENILQLDKVDITKTGDELEPY
jgi:hypothetical protein